MAKLKKIKKPSKSALTRKLDKACSEIVRSKGFCEVDKTHDKETLQCCHIYSRTYRSVRWDVDYNLVCLCASCHFYFHKNPVEFGKFVLNKLGAKNFDELVRRKNLIKRWTIKDMLEYLDILNNYLLKI